MVNIFVIEYEGGRYFVASSDNKVIDYDNVDCPWLGDAKPVGVIKKHANCTLDDVDKCTIYHMYHRDIDKVRGGRFTEDQIREEDLDYIKSEFEKIKSYIEHKNKSNIDLGKIVTSITSLLPIMKGKEKDKDEKKRVRFSETVTETIIPPRINDNLIGINVGGKEFVSSYRMTDVLPLLKIESDDTYTKNNIVYKFFDKDPLYFKDILFWARYGDIKMSPTNVVRYLIKDFIYFGVDPFLLNVPFNKTIIYELPPNNIIKHKFCVANNSLLNSPANEYLKGVDMMSSSISKIKEHISQFGTYIFLRTPYKKNLEADLDYVADTVAKKILGKGSYYNFYMFREADRMVIFWK